MNDMARITGNIKTVDKEYYTQRLNNINNTFNVIQKELDNHIQNSVQLKQFKDLITNEYNKLDILNPYSKQVNKKSKINCV